jgi:hypothetical protein
MVSLIYLAHVRSIGPNRQPFRICREWYYSDTLSARGFPPEVVKTYTDAQAAVPSVTSNRQEVFAQSDLKRLLVQSANYEFVKAFIDFVEGAC